MFKLISIVAILWIISLIQGQPADWIKKIRDYDWLYSFKQETGAFAPAIGNGYLATCIFSDAIYVTGLYNGVMTDENNPSHRARIPSTVNIAITSINSKTPTIVDCALDLETGRYIERFDNRIERTIYTHRVHKHLIVHETKSLTDESFDICFNSTPGVRSPDIDFISDDQTHEYRIYTGKTKLTEKAKDAKRDVTVITWEPKNSKKTGQGEINPWTYCTKVTKQNPIMFYTMIGVDMPKEEIEKTYNEFTKEDPSALERIHKEDWLKLRKEGAGINVEGFPQLAKATNASIYELLISMREDEPWANSPGGLMTNFYNGHIFWDYETWMYPALLVTYPKIGLAGLQYRLDHISGAYAKAESNKYIGAMWPWESAYSGDETTPTFANTGKWEHHISGDIVFAARQYNYLHRNEEVRKKLLCPLAIETARFWASRVEVDAKGKYHIIGVIPPDEYAENITDSIYTNEIAKISLLYANECQQNDTWVEIVDNMYIDYDANLDYHPEFVGYKRGRIVKQADTTLITFPLGTKHKESTQINDLLYYETVTDNDGPAMTWSMFLIASLELYNEKEHIINSELRYFNKAFMMNVKGPFNVWWESPEWGALHFSTGAGGFLQGLLFGYGGIRIFYDPQNPNILARFKPRTPPSPVEKLQINGLVLLEGKVRIDVKIDQGQTYMRTDNENLYLKSEVAGKFTLTKGEWIKIPSDISTIDKNGFYLISKGEWLKSGIGILLLIAIAVLI